MPFPSLKPQTISLMQPFDFQILYSLKPKRPFALRKTPIYFRKTAFCPNSSAFYFCEDALHFCKARLLTAKDAKVVYKSRLYLTLLLFYSRQTDIAGHITSYHLLFSELFNRVCRILQAVGRLGIDSRGVLCLWRPRVQSCSCCRCFSCRRSCS